MRFVHFLFLFLFVQSYLPPIVTLAILLLIGYMVIVFLYKLSLPKSAILLLVLFSYWLINLWYSDGLRQLGYASFYRYDGKFFVTFFILFAFLLTVRYRNERQFYISFRRFIYLLIFISIIGFFPYFDFGLFSSHNANAGFLGSIILVEYLLFVRYYKYFALKRMLIGIHMLYLLFIFLLYFSRAFTAALLAGLILSIFIDKNLRRVSYFGVVFGLLILVVVLSFLSPLPERIYMALVHPEQDYNTFMRLALWQLAVYLWLYNLKTFLFGIGIGRFNDISEILIYKEPYDAEFFFGEHHSHNIILHLLVEQGVVGFLVFFLFFYGLFGDSGRFK